MKNFTKLFATTLIVATFALATNKVTAQTTQPVTLNLVLTDVLLLAVVDVAPTLTFLTQSDYQSGVTWTTGIAAGTVTSTVNNWDLSVVSGTANFGGTSIPVSSVTVTPSGSTGTLSARTLSLVDQVLIDEGPVGLLQPFSLTYSTQPNDPVFYGETAGAYTAALTYSVTVD